MDVEQILALCRQVRTPSGADMMVGFIAYRLPVEPLPVPDAVSVTAGNLVLSVTSLQQQVAELRARLNDEIRATEALAAELRRVNLMRSAP